MEDELRDTELRRISTDHPANFGMCLRGPHHRSVLARLAELGVIEKSAWAGAW